MTETEEVLHHLDRIATALEHHNRWTANIQIELSHLNRKVLVIGKILNTMKDSYLEELGCEVEPQLELNIPSADSEDKDNGAS